VLNRNNKNIAFILPINEQASDKKLLQLFLKGDEKSFSLFYDKHAEKMLHFTQRRMSYNKTDADDVHASVWENFLKRLLNKKTGGEVFIKKMFHSDRNITGSAVPYLQAMIKNKVIDFYRAKERKREDFFEDQSKYNKEIALNALFYETKSEVEIELIELEMYVYQTIHHPILKIKQRIGEASCQTHQKKLMTQKNQAEKKAFILYKTFIMRMAGFNYNDISLELCIDRKTLQKIRGDYNNILGGCLTKKQCNINS
jgi:DNA-directed RNA polymerase specialized sigma24 family protein